MIYMQAVKWREIAQVNIIWTQPPAHYFTQASLLTEPLRACQRLTDWDLAMVNC